MILMGYGKSDFSVCLPLTILRDRLVGSRRMEHEKISHSDNLFLYKRYGKK